MDSMSATICHIAYGNLEAQEFARHQGLDLIGRGCERCCSGEARFAGALEMIRVSIEPDGIGVAITYHVRANTAAADFNRIAVEKAKGNCLPGDVERANALRMLDVHHDFSAGEFPV